MEKTSEQNSLRVVVKKLSSIQLTVSLLFIIAGLSIIGTLIPQNLQELEYVQRYGFKLYRFLDTLGLLDLYHTWWFNGLLGLLLLNLLLCSIDRLPGVFKSIRNIRRDMSDSQMSALPFYRELRLALYGEIPVNKIKEALSRAGGNIKVLSEAPSETFIFWEKGRLSRYGPYITHLGIVVILIGALIGSIFGFRANVNIVEGGSADRVFDIRRNLEIPLGFEVRCEKFILEFYPDSQRPKRFASELKIIENRKVAIEKTIEVNSPLTYKGLTFYQSSYGPAGPPTFDISVIDKKNGTIRNLKLELEKPEGLSKDFSIAVLDYTEDYRGFGPAVLVGVKSGDDHERSFPVFQNFKDLDDIHSTSRYKVVLNKIEPSLYYTGLQVTKDPGTNVVWLGSFIMSIGLYLAFLVYHRRMWIKVIENKGKIIVKVGGFSFKNKLGFEKEFTRFITALENELLGKEVKQ